MSSIFPREQRVEQLFDRILSDPNACRRLKETFYESCPETDLMDADSVEASDKIFAHALIHAYQNHQIMELADCLNYEYGRYMGWEI